MDDAKFQTEVHEPFKKALPDILAGKELPLDALWARNAIAQGKSKAERTVDDVLDAVAEESGVESGWLLTKRKATEVASVRQVVMYLCREMTYASFPEIGRRLHRDHTTVMHGASKIAAILENPRPCDGYVVALVNRCIRNLEAV